MFTEACVKTNDIMQISAVTIVSTHPYSMYHAAKGRKKAKGMCTTIFFTLDIIQSALDRCDIVTI